MQYAANRNSIRIKNLKFSLEDFSLKSLTQESFNQNLRNLIITEDSSTALNIYIWVRKFLVK